MQLRIEAARNPPLQHQQHAGDEHRAAFVDDRAPQVAFTFARRHQQADRDHRHPEAEPRQRQRGPEAPRRGVDPA
jgi:hypothetical protein